MTAAAPEPTYELVVDVAVVGGGLAGLATATHLARRSTRVVCIEPRPWPRPAVGESLEFSAPHLLADLGIDIGCSADQRHLFPKDSVRISSRDEAFTVWPPPWFARPPIWCSRIAFHTDRTELDHQMMQVATTQSVEIIPERVTQVDHKDETITALVTDQGTRISARWFVDATGHARRLFGRTLGLEVEPLGEPRAAFWARFEADPEGHATRLYFPEPDAPDLTWAWEIPLNQGELSIGTVMSAAKVTALRERGLRPAEIFENQLAAIPRLHRVAGGHPPVELHATGYTPYRHRQTLGANWILVGDAAAMVDPLTSNGVTSALRHADQAARTVAHALDHHKLTRQRTWAYRHTAPAMGTTLNHSIEAFLYHPRVRQRMGLQWAVNLYAATGVITNSLYAKINPTTTLRSVGCAAMLAASRLWTRTTSTTAPRLARLRRRPAADSPANPTAREPLPTRHPHADGSPPPNQPGHAASPVPRTPRSKPNEGERERHGTPT